MDQNVDNLLKEIEIEKKARLEVEKLLNEKRSELLQSKKKLKLLNEKLKKFTLNRNNDNLAINDNEYLVLIENIKNLIIRINNKGEIIYANQIAECLLDSLRKPRKNKTKNLFDYIPSAQKKQIFFFFIRSLFQPDNSNYHEIQLDFQKNNPRWYGIRLQFIEERCLTCENEVCKSLIKRDLLSIHDDCKLNHIIVVANDITEQKLAQLELEKSEKRYRELTEFLPEMICELDKTGRITYVNQFAINKLGYTPAEVLEKPFDIYTIFDGKDIPQISKNMGYLLKKGGSASNEYSAIKKNGESFPVIVYSTPIYNQKEIVGIRGVMIDITERKKNELEIAKNLKQQELLSRISLNYNSILDFEKKIEETLLLVGQHTQASRVYIFEDSPDGMFTSNTYEWCNTGISPQINELQNIPYELIPSWKKILNENGIVYSENISELPQDLREILEPQNIISIIIFPLFVEGKFFGFMGFDECSRIRTWSKSEIELLRTISNVISNAYLRNIINNKLINSVNENIGIINSIPDQILRISDTGKVISFESPKNNKLFVNLKKGANEHISTLLNQELSNSFMAAIQECLVNETFKFDFTSLNWDELEYYEARFIKLKEREVLAIVRDVTENKEKEKELQIAKLKAEEASKAKSEFLANVSHEIRTPMNAILGFSEWLHDNVTDHLHKGYLHTIITSGKNLLALINDILDLSRIESGKMIIEMVPLRCELVFHEIKQVLSQKLEDKNLAFNFSIDKSVPNYIYMDEIRFYQILFNLIGNAVKFTSKGYINVSAYATKTLDDNLVDLIINIEDTGIGIREDQQERIFTAFSQQSGQSSRNYEGTGLGLSIVNRLLKKLNGEIKLTSKLGKGSTFTLTFKSVKIAEATEHTKTTSDNHHNLLLDPCKIMIVDDVHFNIMVLKRIIDFENISFLEASSGEQALQLLQTEEPDIIFMDIRMPGLNGYDVSEIIRNTERIKNIPIVAFTASTMHEDMDKINDIFDAFLQKPVFRKEVMAVLTRFLPHRYKTVEKTGDQAIQNTLSPDCIETLPVIIKTLEIDFKKEWESIKNDLIIFDIENFNKRLTDFGVENCCSILNQYCFELNMGLQSFDIELITKKLVEFPAMISNLKSFLQ